MKMTKKVLSFVLSCTVAMGTMFALACTPQQKLAVVTDVQKFIPVVTNVVDAVCAFTPAAAVCTGAATAVSSSAAILDAALVSYFTAEANGTVPPTIIAALSQAISTFEADATNILGAVRILDPTRQAEIAAIAAAAQVLLSVIETLFPTLATASMHLAFGATKPPGFSLNSFAGSYDKNVDVCNAKYMPRGVSLKKIHAHNVFLRMFPGVH
jgi:hypothetical protein